MGKYIIIFIIAFVPMFTSATKKIEKNAESFDIKEIYSLVELEDGVKAISAYDEVSEDLEYLLVPTKVDTGRYNVELTRMAKDLYRVYGTDIVIETLYCYEYAYVDDAVLNIKSTYGYILGEVIFLD